MAVETHYVSEEHARTRLDRFVERKYPWVSRGRLKKAIQSGAITLNGEVRDTGRRLYPGDCVRIEFEQEVVEAMAPEAIPLSILFEDEALIAVDKPAGMLSHPTSKVFSGTLINALNYHLNRGSSGDTLVRPLLVHRLDRATSGVLVVSKTPLAHKRLARQWMDRVVRKRYVALLCGEPPETDGIIDAPIAGVRNMMPGYRVVPDGRPAQSRYRRLRTVGPYCLVELEPLTGRPNQLRVHCNHIGAPIAGDEIHGLEAIAEFQSHNASAPYPDRLLLHAQRLEFVHPMTADPVILEAPVPREFCAFLDRVSAHPEPE